MTHDGSTRIMIYAKAWSLAMLSLLLAVMSCYRESESDMNGLCVEGWIDNDGYPVVILTRALSASDHDLSISDAMIRWGRVTISDGNDTVVMTGGVDGTVFPPYSYRNFDIKGVSGRRYTMTAQYNGMTVTATSVLLPPAHIDTLVFDRVGDGGYAGRLLFTTPADSDTSRYVVMTRIANREYRHYPTMMGAVTVTSAQSAHTVVVYPGRHDDSMLPYENLFHIGDSVDVMLARVDDDVYRFWHGYHNQVYFGNNVFLTAPDALDGNVRGGYGVFSARGVARIHAIVAEP